MPRDLTEAVADRLAVDRSKEDDTESDVNR